MIKVIDYWNSLEYSDGVEVDEWLQTTRAAPLSPERNLMLAVFQHALEDYSFGSYGNGRGGKAVSRLEILKKQNKLEHLSAKAWIKNEKGHLYSFRNIMETLYPDCDVDLARKLILQMGPMGLRMGMLTQKQRYIQKKQLKEE